MNIKDINEFKDKLKLTSGNTSKIFMQGAGIPKKTKIIMRDHNTGEILNEFENKILVPGSQLTACKVFGLEQTVVFPTYNTELELENSLPPFPATQPYNSPIVCLWCAGRSGAGSTDNEINVVANTDRVDPTMELGTLNQCVDLVPFRYVDPDNDIDEDDREYYYGRKIFEPAQTKKGRKIAYFFKAFDTDPQLHVRYLDGTEVTDAIWKVVSSHQVETYVEMRLSVTKKDFRDYFDDVLGWDNADISTISLLTAWYDDTICENPDAPEEEQIFYRWYQDILPYSKFNFGQEKLLDLNRAIDFNYQVYF